MSSNLTVACVLKTGGDFDSRYVWALKGGVEKHLGVPHDFVCLTDDPKLPSDISLPLEYGWRGWWSKMELFRLPGPVLYFDLDTLILGSLDPLAEHVQTWGRNDIGLLRAFRSSERWASGAMAWGGDVGELLTHFRGNPAGWMQRYRGDQDFIKAEARGQGLTIRAVQDGLRAPVLSYKWQCESGRAPGESIVCFHGKPRPLVACQDSEWVRREWCDAMVRGMVGPSASEMAADARKKTAAPRNYAAA